MKFRQFIFEDYRFKAETKELELFYSLDHELKFSEKYKFDFEFAEYDPAVLDRAMQTLFFMAGVSYFKTYIPPEIVIRKGQLDSSEAKFFSKTWQRGLGEFWYVNKLDPKTPVNFPGTTAQKEKIAFSSQNIKNTGLLVAIGGGKDSLVSIEMLRNNNPDLATWSLSHRSQLTPLVNRIGLPHFFVERTWDRQLLELNKVDAFNGHIPISAIFACVGVVVAILSGRRDVVMSNEQTANEPTLYYQNTAINHQYSKSQEFEQDFQAYLEYNFDKNVRYYSFLRPLSEVRIAEIFAKISFDKYKDVFSSCNRAFVHDSRHLFWDGTCAKCAFVFLALTPFLERRQLEALFSDKNLLLTPDLEPTYRQLLGIQSDKPLECVGDIKEAREAMRLSFAVYPELRDKYHFSLPAYYDFRALGTHHMPVEVYSIFQKSLASL